jgi:rhodanese-related sulfurtransferase
LQQQGYTNTLNLEGGLKGWAEKIDPSLKVE